MKQNSLKGLYATLSSWHIDPCRLFIPLAFISNFNELLIKHNHYLTHL